MNIEPLESRIAPASLVYFDADGDRVTITTTGSGALTVGASVLLSSGSATVPAQLQALVLTDAAFAGASVSLAVKKSAGGDGLAHVGFLNATGNDLGAVTIPGDLGRIVCGDAVTLGDPGLGKLKVRSMGTLGTLTQAAGGTLVSVITGAIGRLEVARDFVEAQLETTGTDATIGSILIGGDVVGGAAANSGFIDAEDGAGGITIRGKIIGGGGLDSGELRVGREIASATIGGIVGGTGGDSGGFEYHGEKAKVIIKGSIVGGFGDDSGSLECEGATGTVTVLGSVMGGAGARSGRLDLDDTVSVSVGALTGGAGSDSGQILLDTGRLTIRGNLDGGSVEADGAVAIKVGGSMLGGRISSSTALGAVSIAGSIVGGEAISASKLASLRVGGDIVGTANNTADARIFITGDVGKVFIGGSLIGGPTPDSGRFEVTGNVAGYVIRGSVIGGDGGVSGILSGATVGKIVIGGDLAGGNGGGSGSVRVTLFDSLTIGRSIIGGSGNGSGSVDGAGGGLVKVGGDVRGGDGTGSGSILGFVGIGGVRIRGSLIGGEAANTGVISTGSGLGDVFIGGDVRGSGFADTGKISTIHMGRVFIGGDLVGGDFAPAVPRADSGIITGGEIEAVTIRGSLIAGSNAPAVPAVGASGAIIANTLGPVVIGGSVIGSATNRALIQALSADGEKPLTGFDVAIASVAVKGDVQFADILAGFTGFTRTPANADAAIGPVTIGGDWRASNLVAGAQDAGAAGFGIGDQLQTVDDTALIARIAKIRIGGEVLGTAQTVGDHFGFVAQQLDALTISGRIVPLSPDPAINDNLLLSPTGDIRALEVG